MVRHKKNDEEGSPDKKSSAIGDVHRKLVHVRSRKDRVNEALEALQSYTEKGGILCNKNKAKALALYQTLLKACESEGEYIRRLLSEIEKIRRSEFKKQDEIGTKTACFDAVDQPAGIKKTCQVVAVSPTGRYDVKDVDDEQKVRLTMARRRLIPLPKWRADPERDAHALFPLEAIVLALYPQTTCFYKGVVQKVPQLVADDYLVAFKDPSYSTGYSLRCLYHSDTSCRSKR
ncbi:hypothetical protein COOONC_22547 [Cooperia oncophora]